MTVDRSLYQTSYYTLPEWLCPTCGKGHLLVDPKAFLNIEAGPSKQAHKHEEWDPEWIERRFAGLLECNFAMCGERVAIFGNVSVEEQHEQNYDGDWEQSFPERFHPRGLTPAPLPINPPTDTPDNVKTALGEAAGLLWQSAEGAANQIRQAVEYLMDEQGVTKSTPGAFLSLHNRIKEFEKKDASNAEILLAVKWLGNSGSHAGGLTREDLFDAFDMVELVLVALYDSSYAQIMAKVKAVNTQKGPVKPTP